MRGGHGNGALVWSTFVLVSSWAEAVGAHHGAALIGRLVIMMMFALCLRSGDHVPAPVPTSDQLLHLVPTASLGVGLLSCHSANEDTDLERG